MTATRNPTLTMMPSSVKNERSKFRLICVSAVPRTATKRTRRKVELDLEKFYRAKCVTWRTFRHCRRVVCGRAPVESDRVIQLHATPRVPVSRHKEDRWVSA